MSQQSGVTQFENCVLGPVNFPGTGHGIPDGAHLPSVVIDYRSTVILKPNPSGNLTFALVPGATGAIALGTGEATLVTVPVLNADAAAGGTVVVGSAAIQLSKDISQTDGENNYTVLPYMESLGHGYIGEPANNGFRPTQFRVSTNVAEVVYSGSMMTNMGTAATCRVSHGFDEDTTNPFPSKNGTTKATNYTNRGCRLLQTPPTGFTSVASMPGARVFPARESVQLINVPHNFDYQPVRNHWAPFTLDLTGNTDDQNDPHTMLNWFGSVAVALNAQGAISSQIIAPVMGYGHADVTYVSYSGLDKDATITVSSRTCVEYTLAVNSPLQHAAARPPPKNQAALDRVQSIARVLPSSAPSTPEHASHGWLANAASWYGNTMKSIVGKTWSITGNVLGGLAQNYLGGSKRGVASLSPSMAPYQSWDPQATIQSMRPTNARVGWY